MTVMTAAGATLGVTSSAPATYDAAGYAALTFTTVGEVTDLGEIGRIYNLVTFQPMRTRGTRKHKGSFNDGSMAISMGLDNSDAGQQLLRAGRNSDNDFFFCLKLQNGDRVFFPAQVTGFKRTIGSVDKIVQAASTLELTSVNGTGIVELAASVTPTPTPQLAVNPTSATMTTATAAGTVLAAIGNVPAGATPTITPNDGRLVIAGDATNGWKVAVGSTAASAGTINATVAAAGASSVALPITVSTAASQPTVTLSGAQSKAEGNSGATLFTYTVTLSAAAPAGGVNVPWSFTAGSTSADDFTGGVYPTGGTVAIAAGQTTGTFSVSVNGDATVESDESFTVLISTPSGYVAGATTSATGTILNDDAASTKVLMVAASGLQIASQSAHGGRGTNAAYHACNKLIALGPKVGSQLRLVLSNKYCGSGNFLANGNDIQVTKAAIIQGSTWSGGAWTGGTIYPVTYQGASTFTVPDNTDILLDHPAGYVPVANEVVRWMVSCNIVGAAGLSAGSASIPCNNYVLDPFLGEGAADGSTSQDAKVAIAFTNTGFGGLSGGGFGPTLAFTDLDPGTLTACAMGDSRNWGGYTRTDFANARGILGYTQKALDDTTTGPGRISAMDVTSFGSSLASYVQSSNGPAICSWLAHISADLLSGSPMFNRAIVALGINDFSGSATFAQMQSRALALRNAVKAFSPNCKFFIDTTSPATSGGASAAGNNYVSLDEADQTTWAKTAQGPDPSARSQWNAYLRAGDLSAIGFDGIFDTATVNEGLTTPAKVKPSGFSTTVTQAYAANSGYQIHLADVPPNGYFLVFDAGDASLEDVVNSAIASNCYVSFGGASDGAGGYLVNAGATIKKAHAVGAKVIATPSLDKLHFCAGRQEAQTAIVIANKALLA